MDALPHSLLTLCLLTFTLGLRHGLDPDHLAAIDGLTRFNSRARPGLARFCGALFSLGHGVVVIGIAVAVSVLAGRWHTPELLALIGAWISIGFLAALGLVNLAIAIRTDPRATVQPVGLKGRLVRGFSEVSNPAAVALVGVLFAISFDTVSQASLFAVMASQFGGLATAIMLGAIFTSGMLLVDGANGWWISHLLRRADRVAVVASRVMSLVVALLSLAVASLGALRLASPSIDGWSEGKELVLGCGVIVIIGLSFLLALVLARPTATAQPGD